MPSDGGDSGAASGRSATAPGMGPPSSGRRAAAEAPAVDFDALSAALGGAGATEDAHGSHGRSNASYASARPHSVPAAYVTSEATAPAVIVSVDDTVPSAPPVNMTTPIGSAVPHTMPLAIAGVPSSGSIPAAAQRGPSSEPFTPLPFTPAGRGANQMTMRMAERPRRPRAMTVVMRPRGPSTAQKLVAFMAMLVLVTACGIAVIIWRKPQWLGLVPESVPRPRAMTATPAAQPKPSMAPAAPSVPTASLSSLPAPPVVTHSATTTAHPPAPPPPKRAPKPVPTSVPR